MSRGTVSSTIVASAMRKSVKACQRKSAELLTVSSLARAWRTLARSRREKAVVAVQTFKVHALKAFGVDSRAVHAGAWTYHRDPLLFVDLAV